MESNPLLTFILDEDFVESYASRPVAWGFQSPNGMSIGEFTYLRTYSRLKSKTTGRAWDADGLTPIGSDVAGKERWHETLRRVVEGSYSVQKNHCKHHKIPWDEYKAQESAQEMYDRMFRFKIWAPGRGLANMGMPYALTNSAWLFNCSFVSTESMWEDPVLPFTTLMDFSLIGIGVGFDTKGGELNPRPPVYKPSGYFPYQIPDSREGWVKSVELLLRSYLVEGNREPVFNYDLIRPRGSIIRTTGGIAPGPEPLRECHETLRQVINPRMGRPVNSRLIVDIANIIGRAILSGGKRRTALLALGSNRDADFMSLKDSTKPENAERIAQGTGWAHTSNNSIVVGKYGPRKYEEVINSQLLNGEPGLFYSHNVQHYGRMVDGYQEGIDKYAIGTNPCGEISLEDKEVCNLVSLDPNRHEDLADYERSLKFAYLYSKSVTLMSTHNEETNAVQLRNRRIGVSLSGIASFVDTHGWWNLDKYLDKGYQTVRDWDHVYSRWLGVRESIKVTTVKPEGSAALLSGSTPGVHWPTAKTYIRRIRVEKTNPLIPFMERAGYDIEDDVMNPSTTAVVSFPVYDGRQVRTDQEVGVEEKLGLVARVQYLWADNSVSCTLTFDPETELEDTVDALIKYEDDIKSLSFLPLYTSTHPQRPYQGIEVDEYERYVGHLTTVDLDAIYEEGSFQASDDKFCTSETCEL